MGWILWAPTGSWDPARAALARSIVVTDTELNRQVALKILSEAFASDPDRLARFQREARLREDSPGARSVPSVLPWPGASH